MKNKFALLLALPVSLLLQAGLITQQTSQASPASDSLNNSGNSQSCIQLASLMPGSIPNLLPPVHQTLSPVISQPKPAKTTKLDQQKKKVVAPLPAKSATTKVEATSKKAISSKVKTKSKKSKRRSRARLAAIARPAKSDAEIVKNVSLTFDDGPNPTYTPQVLAILKKEGVHATFCLVGRQVKKYPELVQQIVADGHKIADHSMNHDEHLGRRSDAKIKQEILGTKTLIESIVPGTSVDLYRAPGGNMTHHQRELLTEWGMKPLSWSVDTKDWQRVGVDQIMATVDAQLHPGGVILMHDAGGDRSETVVALQKVITKLKKDGYQFTFPG